MILLPFVILLGLAYLTYATVSDIKKREVDVPSSIAFAIISITLIGLIIDGNFLAIALSITLLGIMTALWEKGMLGGADVKIIAGLPPFILFGLSGITESLFAFMCVFIFLSVTGFYTGIWKLRFMNEKTAPLLPAILIAYVISILFRIALKI